MEDDFNDNHIKAELFMLFDEYKYDEDIIDRLRSLCTEKVISKAEYDIAIKNYNKYLDEWTAYEEEKE